jgi:hypothetical protein
MSATRPLLISAVSDVYFQWSGFSVPSNSAAGQRGLREVGKSRKMCKQSADPLRNRPKFHHVKFIKSNITDEVRSHFISLGSR